MIQTIITICRDHPQIVLFISLALGFFLGRLQIFGITLGSTASVLLVSLVVGQIDVTITPLIKSVAFALFIFTIGYKGGPHFFRGLKKDGIWYAVLALFVACVGLATALIFGKLFGFDKGTTAGLLGGAMTQSSILGTAHDAIQGLSIPASQKAALNANSAVAYAITYIFGVAGLILFYKFIPKLLNINLAQQAQQYEGAPSTTSGQDYPFNPSTDIRTYQLTNTTFINNRLATLEKKLPDTIAIEKIQRKNHLLDSTPGLTLHKHDIIAVIVSRDTTGGLEQLIGPETNSKSLIALPYESADIIVTKPTNAHITIKTLRSQWKQRCLITSITAHGQELPLHDATKVHRGTILHVIGLKTHLEQCAHTIGYLQHATGKTDLAYMSTGCFLGTVIGLIAIPLGSIPFTLSIGGGVLLAGLIFGWLRSVYKTFGFMPESAQWFLTELGLNLFIACVGLTAGPKALHALYNHGITLFFAGIGVTLIPTVAGLAFGRFVLRLDYVVLLGALTGAGTATPALNVVKNEANSFAPVLGYTVPYAIANFILTIWGTVIVHLL